MGTIFGLRARLMVLAFMIISPLVIDRIRLVEFERDSRIEAAAKEALAIARYGLDAHHDVIVATRALLLIVQRALTSQETSGCESLLNGTVNDVPWIKGLTLATAEGRVACSTMVSSVGLDVSDREYFQRAVVTSEFVLSDYIIAGGQRAPTVIGAQKIVLGDKTAVLMAAIDLQWIGRLAAVTSGDMRSTVLLLDSRGTILVAHPERHSLVGKALPDIPLTRAVLAHADGALRAEGIDGKRRIFGFVRIPATDVRLVVGIDEADVLASVNEHVRIAYFQLTLIVSLVIGAWLIGMRLIMDPIRLLARTAKRYGSGQLQTRISDRPMIAEFAPLAGALENMAQKLGAREDELLSANRRLEQLANSDPLTGIGNRRSFDLGLQREWADANSGSAPLALLMIDIDYFKLFNDENGHLQGDACLRAVGTLLAGVAEEKSGLAARFGGEEFVVLLPGCTERTAIEIATQIRRAVESLRISHPKSPTGRLSVSIGVASCIPGDGQEPAALIDFADAALYAAKRRGRNAVVAHKERDHASA